ncbi:helix-turn-helix transcriptional regulator [Propionicimonas sp.]|uniref:helix-turn-helix transcriptional regulator n=1 Tax=Propionicimonas sp. TaxID=1955623 RepID=UPI0039E365C3
MADHASPTARALLTLELIQTRPGITAGDLAGALGVSERAARRYVGILREAEIPIRSVPGVRGGYTVGRGVRLPPLVFSSTEALGMVMAVLDSHHDAADNSDPVGNALRKIIRALPEAVATQAEVVRRTARPVPDRHAVPPDPTTTAALVLASSCAHVVRIGYRTGSGSEWEAVVEPWAVVVRHGRWYLLCRRPRDGAIRTYRVDRVRSVAELEEPFEPPADLDPVAALEENFAVGWEFAVEILVDGPLGEVQPWVPRAIGRLEAVDAEHTRMVGTTSDPPWFAEMLAALPMPFHVIDGPELRAAVDDLGRRLLAAVV